MKNYIIFLIGCLLNSICGFGQVQILNTGVPELVLSIPTNTTWLVQSASELTNFVPFLEVERRGEVLRVRLLKQEQHQFFRTVQRTNVLPSEEIVVKNLPFPTNVLRRFALAGTDEIIGATSITAGDKQIRYEGGYLKIIGEMTAGDTEDIRVLLSDGTVVGRCLFQDSAHPDVASVFLTHPLYIDPRQTVLFLYVATLKASDVSLQWKSGRSIGVAYHQEISGPAVSFEVTTGTPIQEKVVGVAEPWRFVFRAFPEISFDLIGAASIFIPQSYLHIFHVKAIGGDIQIGEMDATIQYQNAHLRNWGFVVVEDPQTLGRMGGFSSSDPLPITIPEGQTRYVAFWGTVDQRGERASISTTVSGDVLPEVGGGRSLDQINSQFIWSPNSHGKSLPTDADWFNGFNVPGLSAEGMTQVISWHL